MAVPVYVNGRFTAQRVTGVQRYAAELVGRFARAGHDPVTLAPPARFAHGAAAQLWEQVALPLQLPRGARLWSPTNSGPLAVGDHIVTVHDGAVLSHPEWFSRGYVAWRRRLLPRLLQRARHVITVSAFSKRHLCEATGVPADKISVVANGVDLERFRPAPAEQQERARRRYNLPERYLLALGSLEPRKNFRRLVDAWTRLRGEVDADLALAIVGGEGRAFADAGLAIPAGAGITLLGYVPDDELAALYSGARLFVFPTLFEGFGLPVLEAMACGAAVVSSNTTAVPEVAGGHARLIDPYDTDAIASAIIALLGDDDERCRLAAAGPAHAARFDWDATARRTWSILQAQP